MEESKIMEYTSERAKKEVSLMPVNQVEKRELCSKEDEPKVIADKIFYGFVINQAYSVTGYVKDAHDNVEIKGDVVLRLLRELDSKQNMNKHTDKRLIRRRKQLPESIGGYVAQKIFRFKHETFGAVPYVTIWRMQ